MSLSFAGWQDNTGGFAKWARRDWSVDDGRDEAGGSVRDAGPDDSEDD
jgi:hypothetical protein